MVSNFMHIRKAVIALLASFFVITVCADEIPDNTQGNDQLDTIVVTGTPATAQPMSDIAGSVGVVNRDELALVQHSHITESADRIAGVWVSRGNGQEHLTAIRSPVFTGPGSCGEFVVLEDGIPTRPAGFCNVNQLFEINSEQADRIEIFKGPVSSVYGSNAVHGVINVLSPTIAMREQSTVTLDGGPHDYARAFLSYSDGKNMQINMHGDHDGGYIDDSGFDQQKLNVKFSGEQGDYHVENFIEMTNLNQETAGYLVGKDSYKDDSFRTTNFNPEAFRDAKSIHGYSKWIGHYGESREFQITPYANAASMEFIQHFTPQEPLEKNGSESVGLNGKFSYPVFDISPEILAVHSGFNLETARVYVDEFQSKATSGKYTQGQHYDFDVFLNSLALSSEVEYHLVPTLKLLAGARYEQDYYNYNNNVNPIPLPSVSWFTPPSSRDDRFGNWGLNAGSVWDWVMHQQVFVNVSSGFRAPQVAELYRLEGGQPANSVQSEKIDSVEFGFRGTIKPVVGDTLFYEASIFDMYKNHVILKQSNHQYLGDGETSHKGIELSLDYRFLQSAYIKTSATYAEHRYEQINGQLQGSPAVDLTNNMIDTAPRHYGNVQVGNFFHWGMVEFEIKHIGAYYLNPENTQQYPGHNLFNLRSEWNVMPDLKLGARLLNILNTDYAERADVTVSATPVPRYFVGEPRSLYVSIEKTFY